MKNEAFRAFYYSVPLKGGDRIKLRDKIREACDVTVSVFYNWTKSTTPVPKACRKIIAEIAGKEEKELFPEILN